MHPGRFSSKLMVRLGPEIVSGVRRLFSRRRDEAPQQQHPGRTGDAAP
jgi:hypothetical protein